MNRHAAGSARVYKTFRVPHFAVHCPGSYRACRQGKKARKERKNPLDYSHNSIPFRTEALCKYVKFGKKQPNGRGMMT